MDKDIQLSGSRIEENKNHLRFLSLLNKASAVGIFLLFGLLPLSNICFSEENSLVERSPFLPPGYNNKTKNENVNVRPPPPPPPPIPPSVELRGIIEFGGKVQFSLFDKKTQKGSWYFLDESKDGYSIKNYDKINNSITIIYNGTEFNIDLKEPSVEAPVGRAPIANVATTQAAAQTGAGASATEAAPAATETPRAGGSRRDRNISGIRQAVSNLNQ